MQNSPSSTSKETRFRTAVAPNDFETFSTESEAILALPKQFLILSFWCCVSGSNLAAISDFSRAQAALFWPEN